MIPPFCASFFTGREVSKKQFCALFTTSYMNHVVSPLAFFQICVCAHVCVIDVCLLICLNIILRFELYTLPREQSWND